MFTPHIRLCLIFLTTNSCSSLGINTEPSWHYLTDNILIDCYSFNICLNQQIEALEVKISSQDTATSDIKQDIELIREDINKGNNQVKKYQMSTKIRWYSRVLNTKHVGNKRHGWKKVIEIKRNMLWIKHMGGKKCSK